MSIRFFAAILLTLFASSYSIADDYLLRLETVDLRDLQNGDQEPVSGIFESIEIVVRKNQSFFGSMKMGVDKITISGTIQESRNEKLLVNVHYKRLTDTGEFVPGVDGKKHPILECLAFDTKAKLIEVGKPVAIDALVSQSKSKRLSLVIDNFDRPENQD